MPATRDLAAPVLRLSPSGEHCFFGYYDVPAADAWGRHLCHRVPFRDRFPAPGDVAQLGWCQLGGSGGTFTTLAETGAWNFQQGSMLQWLPSEPGVCVFNTVTDAGYGSRVFDVASGRSRDLPLPIASVSRDGRAALCLNMSRIYDFRPGYGYEEHPDPWRDEDAPDDDGIATMDLASGGHRLLLSFREMAGRLSSEGALTEPHKLVVNHITWNPTGSRFLFLVRTFPRGSGEGWVTFLLTADREGRDVRLHPTWGMASHYHWRSDDEVLVWTHLGPERQASLLVLNDETGERLPVDDAFFAADGHCSHSPDGRWVLYDGYADAADEDHSRWLAVYSLERKAGWTLGRFRSELPYRLTETGEDWSIVDLRCDLHPRWMPDGRSITFDSIHEGHRALYRMDLAAVMG